MVMYLIKMCPQKMYTKMFILTLFIIAPNWKKKQQLQSSKDSAQFIWGNM